MYKVKYEGVPILSHSSEVCVYTFFKLKIKVIYIAHHSETCLFFTPHHNLYCDLIIIM